MRLQQGVLLLWRVVVEQLLVGAVRLLVVVLVLAVDPGSRLHRVAGSAAAVVRGRRWSEDLSWLVLVANRRHQLRWAAVVSPLFRPDR